VPAPVRLYAVVLAALTGIGPALAAEAVPVAPDPQYVLVGVVEPPAGDPAAHFRLLVTEGDPMGGPRPGQSIPVRFLNDHPDVPPVGTRVRVQLLGQTEGLYLVHPGTQCEPVSPTAATPKPPPADGGWAIGAATVAVAGLVVAHVWRTTRRGNSSPPTG